MLFCAPGLTLMITMRHTFLMDHAVQNAAGYIERHPDAPLSKLAARIKSVIRRRAASLRQQ
jgi:hypothetical protein